VEEIAFLAVVLCSVMGWKWDGGLVDQWIESMINVEAEDCKKKELENMGNAEKGIIPEEAVDSKERLLMDEKAAEGSI